MISCEQKRELRRNLAEFLYEDEPLAAKTTLKTGGPAEIFIQPVNLTELQQVLKVLADIELGFLLLGGGSNMLVADQGVRGKAVISLGRGFKEFTISGADKYSVMVRAGAGMPLTGLIRTAVIGGYSGLEKLTGIPGTLGGALAMNAGAYGSTIYDKLTALVLIKNGVMSWVAATDLNPVYRDGGLSDNDIVVAAYFHLQRKLAAEIAVSAAEIRQLRRQYMPKGASAGSVFKNPSGDFAGRLLEEAGCKGLTCGGARVASEHANVIVAEKYAKSQDIIDLMGKMHALVRKKFNVDLEPEIKVVS